MVEYKKKLQGTLWPYVMVGLEGWVKPNPKFREISQMSRRPLKICVMLCPFAAVSFPRQRVDRVGRVSLHG